MCKIIISTISPACCISPNLLEQSSLVRHRTVVTWTTNTRFAVTNTSGKNSENKLVSDNISQNKQMIGQIAIKVSRGLEEAKQDVVMKNVNPNGSNCKENHTSNSSISISFNSNSLTYKKMPRHQ